MALGSLRTAADWFEDQYPHATLTGSVSEFREPHGRDLLGRLHDFFAWQNGRRQAGLWPYGRSSRCAPIPRSEIADDAGRVSAGINLASHDYLGLASHPAIKEAAIEAVHEFGVHSAGTPVHLGNTAFSEALERRIGHALGYEHVTLFPTGWAAGYGTVTGLVRNDDHVVIDAECHASLQEGAFAATRKVHRHPHLDVDSMRHLLARIRKHDSNNAILVVTESLFATDAGAPKLAVLHHLCRSFDATLLVGCAHDLGALGPDGTGFIGAEGMLGQIDLVVGSFSKTFASNGGFVACRQRSATEYIRSFSTAYASSSAISPVQAAIVARALEIVESDEGDDLRTDLMVRSIQLREGLQAAGLQCLGVPSPIVPVLVGAEALSRIASHLLPRHGVIANLVEHPAVERNAARFLLHVMATHTADQINAAVSGFREASDQARGVWQALSAPVRQ